MERLRICLDVETVPTQDEKFIQKIDIKCPGNYKVADSIAKWEKDTKPGLVDAAYRKTSFDSTQGELVVIGWAINDEEPQAVYRNLDESEGDMLKGFYAAIEPHIADHSANKPYYSLIEWIGHNVLRFDLPYLWHRTKINKVTPTVKVPYNVKPWDETIFDTQATWKAASSASSSLEAICTAIGIPVKTSMHGSEVWDYMQAGRVEEVAEYCKEDVRATRALANVLR